MRFELDPVAVRRGDFDLQIKRGWYLGSREFRENLSEGLTAAEKGDNFRGEQRRGYNEDAAESYLKEGKKVLGLEEADLAELAHSDARKQALAWWIKTRTSVTGVSLCKRLSMGHRSNLSRALVRFRDSNNKETRELVKVLTKCTGCPF